MLGVVAFRPAGSIRLSHLNCEVKSYDNDGLRVKVIDQKVKVKVVTARIMFNGVDTTKLPSLLVDEAA